MNLLQSSRLWLCALSVAFLAGCGGSSSNDTVPQTVSTFYAHTAVFKNNTTVLSGYNAFGQLGTGDLKNQSSFNKVSGLSLKRVDGFAAGGAHTLAFQRYSTVQAWGSNQYGQLGGDVTTGSSASSKTPVNVLKENGSILTGVTGVAAGGYHSLAISGGNVWAWGDNGAGQLGNGDSGFSQKTRAVQVIDESTNAPLSDIVLVAAGGTCSYAMNSNGQVWGWGNNVDGQLLINKPDEAPINYANKAHRLSLTFPVKAISARGSYAVVIKKDDDTVWAWGYDGWGQIGIDPTDAATLGKDSKGNTKEYVLTPHQITILGSNGSRTELKAAALPADVANQRVLAAGSDHVLVLTPEGTVYAWGLNYYGQLGNNERNATSHEDGLNILYYSSNPLQVKATGGTAGQPSSSDFLTGVTEVYAYGHSSFAVANGKLVAWGSNLYGQLGFSDPSKSGMQENPAFVPGF